MFLAEEKLFVACELGTTQSLNSVLPKFVNKFGIEYLEINSESWKNLISQVFEFTPQPPIETVQRSGNEAKNLNNPKETEEKSDKLAQLGAHLLKTIDDIPLKRINAVDDTSIASEVKKILLRLLE